MVFPQRYRLPAGGGSYGWFLSGCFYVSSATRRRRAILNGHRECSEVQGSVVITIAAVTAVVADEHPNIKGQFGFHCLTVRAGLTRRIPPVRHMQTGASPIGLVSQLPSNFGESRITDRAIQPTLVGATGSAHSGDIEVFDDDGVVDADELGGEFVKVVAATVGDPGMYPLNLVLRAEPPIRGLLAGTAVRPVRRAPRRCRRRSFFACLRACFGFSISSPVERTRGA